MAPPNTPEWMLQREALWNAVERVEKRHDAQLCREVQLALPHEIGKAAQLELVRGFVERAFVSNGMVADIAIHASHRKGDRRNEHAHVMLTLREITKAGFGKKDRSWNDRALIGQWREEWAERVNYALARAGRDERVDHRTLEAQRRDAERQAIEARASNDNERAQALEVEAIALNREPQPKIGHIAMALERQGQRTERGDLWRAVMARNLARFRGWLELQRERLSTTWEIVRSVFERSGDRAVTPGDKNDRDAAEIHGGGKDRPHSDEVRDRLLGRRPSIERPEGADVDRETDKQRDKSREDDRER